MNFHSLDFEKPILELEEKINVLLKKFNKKDFFLKQEIKNLQKESKKLTKKIFSQLEDWQIVQISRHYMRPHTLDYIENIFTDFDELHGDRYYSNDNAIVGGIARLDGRSIVVIGHQKGRGIKERMFRNFGMPTPEGYRKALRIMKLADRFKIPLITFIDTPGAYPGIGAEKRGQSRAIAKNLQEMSDLRVPIICTVIGEGGSGGALAIGVGDKVNMLEYSTYSVISPEGCATILWKDIKKAPNAAKSMHIVTKKIKKLNLIDSIIPEPLGGAHRDFKTASFFLKRQILSDLFKLDKLTEKELLYFRYKKLMHYGY